MYVLALFAVLGVLEVGARLSENVFFPRQIDPAWVEQRALPPGPGDSWIGNVASDGERIYVASRQLIRGFWGLLGIWSSEDGGTTWSAPALVSRHDIQDAARHAVSVAPDGELFAAFAEQGERPVTQRLFVRVSFDHGHTWSGQVPVSPPQIGLIGLPVLLLTDDIRLVAYTDGETGDVLIQRINTGGGAAAEPVVVGRTTRQLYNNADFHDAAISLASAQGRIVAVWVEDRSQLRAAFSSDGGATWKTSTGINQNLYGARPRLASNGTDILLAATDPNTSARYVQHPFIRIWHSTDGGQTFERGPDVTDVVSLGWLELIWADGRWRLAYDACPGFFTCATVERIWYTESANGETWSDPIVISAPGPVRELGLVAGKFGLATVWADGTGDHDWILRLALRPPREQ